MWYDVPRLLWIKSVTRDDDLLAYAGEDPTTRAREPRAPGDAFDLHASQEAAESLALPAVGDIIALTQHDQLTHLVEVTGAGVEKRPRRTMRAGTRDARYSVQRACKLLVLRVFADAPMIDEAFGFDPDAKGGDVFEIASLPAVVRSGVPLWAVQRRIDRAIKGELRAQVHARRRARSRSW
ncbi:MAG: hypothetical protein IT384_31975 [Deltaproteobacteria bacterium]|nr:hypothetical protein [Deltaproteobacteria bacterium]